MIKVQVGERYNIGGSAERTNLEITETICALLDVSRPRTGGRSHLDFITYFTDRLGHDRRYAIDLTKRERELVWTPLEMFKIILTRTVDWYLVNGWWWRPIREQHFDGSR